ncbi:hypothetical protein F2P56_012529 [Juglans regia]|uniref:Uncharacterized protein n=1 Tax=Juglans regia TaxID=51240 RepID=A0A833XLP8_JUGRE|nr:hypothetical protein F2P56_012529 [Juglans regia]
MSYTVSKTQPSVDSNAENIPIDIQEEPGVEETQNPVTRHLYIKPSKLGQTLNREVVLRRIRQRKRMNKLKATLLALIRLPFSKKADKEASAKEKKWVDDAFAAL